MNAIKNNVMNCQYLSYYFNYNNFSDIVVIFEAFLVILQSALHFIYIN